MSMHGVAPLLFFFFNDTATTEIYTLSLHDALPISRHRLRLRALLALLRGDRSRPRRARARPQRAAHRDGAARGTAARPGERGLRAARRARLQGRQRGGRRLHARHRPPRAAGDRPGAPRAAAALPGARPPAAREGRGHAAGAQALVHVDARPVDGAAHAGALLEHGGADGRARARGLRRAPSPHGGPAAVPARPLHLRAAAATQAPLPIAHALTPGYGKTDIPPDASLPVDAGG